MTTAQWDFGDLMINVDLHILPLLPRVSKPVLQPIESPGFDGRRHRIIGSRPQRQALTGLVRQNSWSDAIDLAQAWESRVGQSLFIVWTRSGEANLIEAGLLSATATPSQSSLTANGGTSPFHVELIGEFESILALGA